MRTPLPMHRRGFTLIEPLIGMLVLSMGLMGAAAMLLDSLHQNEDALRRAAALDLVRDLAERIRANPGALAAYDTRGPGADGIAVDCDAAFSCRPEQRAAGDLAALRGAALALLPALQAQIQVEYEPATGPAAPARYAIALRWQPPRAPVELREEVALQVLVLPPVAG